MKSPEQALAEARARSASAAEDEAWPEEAGTSQDPRQARFKRLTEWAMIEPDEEEVYSTRSWGAPITALKQTLIRLLRQWVLQISSQQTRFNVYSVGELAALDERVRALEAAAKASPGSGAPAASPADVPAPPAASRPSQSEPPEQ